VDVRSEIMAAPISPLVTPIDVFSYTMKRIEVRMPDRIDKLHIHAISLKKAKDAIMRLQAIAPMTNPDKAIMARCIFHPMVAIVKPIKIMIAPARRLELNIII